ncbi:hypothetical protein BS50DRAFT_570544 [Corynespora cassiicola Philippines]|uniref:S-adenosyl-L-methionine-dependent methyltransferase n=1 Tax=Corynespora cassiicola Philippines TaxID=1448308 RepID=A0A2T2P1B2_CORCC|nr:hypothetical protein BS50DRAFT_570544 [Corynespora cassiicola Philippines]
MAQQCPFAEVVGLDMAVWDLETTESIAGESRVTWEIDDLDVWGVESEVDDLSLMLEHYDPFHDPTHRPLFEPASKARQKHGGPHSPDPTASDDTAFDPYVLEPPAQPGWNFSEPFDLIHLRNMKGVFAAWEDVYAEIYKNLSPGGWVEIADFDIAMPDAGDTANPLFPTISKLCRSLMQASFKAGRPAGTFYMHPSYLEEAGFKDVHTTYVNVPVGQWPEDEEQKKIGKMMFVVAMESLEPLLLRLLTSCGDAEKVWTAREVREHVERSKKEILEWSAVEPGLRGWCAHFKWIVGRKSKNA